MSAQRQQVANPYQSMLNRVQRAIMSPAAQVNRSVCLYRLPEEEPQVWDQLIDDISENNWVRAEHLDDGGIRLTWEPPSDE